MTSRVLVALECVAVATACVASRGKSMPQSRVAATVETSQATCPPPDSIRAAFVRDSLDVAAGRNHQESTGYVTFIVDGVVVAANVHRSGAEGSFAERAGMPPLDSLGVESLQVYKAANVPAGYAVCPGVGVVVIVTKRARRPA